MSTLEAFKPKSDFARRALKVAGHDTSSSVEHGAKAFFKGAGHLLKLLSHDVLGKIVPDLDRYQGQWDPIGFMVFSIGVDRYGQSLRLHIWPDGEKQESDHEPFIHNHKEHHASLVLVGEPMDTTYVVNRFDNNPLDDESVLRSYKQVSNAGGICSRLETDGSRAQALSVEVVLGRPGDIIQVKAGEFHRPNVLEGLAATLVLASPSSGSDKTFLINSRREPLFVPTTMTVTSDVVRVKRQLLGASSSR